MIRHILTFTIGVAATIFLSRQQYLSAENARLKQHLDDAHETLADMSRRMRDDDEILTIPRKQVVPGKVDEWPESIDIK